MSFDLGVFYSSRPLTKAEASQRYLALCDRELSNASALQELIEPNTRLAEFCAELLALYPPLSLVADEDNDDSPWSCDPDVSEGHIIMSIRWSMCSDIVPIILEMALTRELIIFDPQEDEVYLPPSLYDAVSKTRQAASNP